MLACLAVAASSSQLVFYGLLSLRWVTPAIIRAQAFDTLKWNPFAELVSTPFHFLFNDVTFYRVQTTGAHQIRFECAHPTGGTKKITKTTVSKRFLYPFPYLVNDCVLETCFKTGPSQGRAGRKPSSLFIVQ